MIQELLNFDFEQNDDPILSFYTVALDVEYEFKISVIDNSTNDFKECLGTILFEKTKYNNVAIYELKHFKIHEKLSREQVREFLEHAFIVISQNATDLRLNGCGQKYDVFCKYDGDLSKSYLFPYFKNQDDGVYVR